MADAVCNAVWDIPNEDFFWNCLGWPGLLIFGSDDGLPGLIKLVVDATFFSVRMVVLIGAAPGFIIFDGLTFLLFVIMTLWLALGLLIFGVCFCTTFNFLTIG